MYKLARDWIYGFRNFEFAFVEGKEIGHGHTCKEEYLCDLMDAYNVSSAVDYVAGVFVTTPNKDLRILNSFEEEFNLSRTKITQLEPHFCVVRVPARWKKNWITLGLFLTLFRASIMSQRVTWRVVKHWDMNRLNKCSPEKIKALWSKDFESLVTHGDYDYTYNCLFFLEQFCASNFFEDFGIRVDADNLPLINYAVKFENL